ncbi:transmembrane protein 41B-like isoform X1 [Ostrea edulis]|uniref:transmembrane protein 41B-like isoform X1 n=1 Tax=Ostrea edulis TaxID=37623 RepID=UPI0024AFA954|nr:transmembrane protein 41B-like isoform X1 [Ostrea edulis]
MADKTKASPVKNRNMGKEDDEGTRYTELRPKSMNQSSSTKSFIILGLIFVTSILCLGLIYLSFPNLDQDEKQHIKLPRNIEDAKSLGKVLSRYKDSYYNQVLGGYFITYIFLQSFAIPGSIFLSILSGFLFPFHIALFLVCLCSGIGASFCYLLSYLVGRRLVAKYIPERIAEWQSHVNKHREHLLNYIIFLRITPFLPNWFINIASPVINVPILPFFLGTFIGKSQNSQTYIMCHWHGRFRGHSLLYQGASMAEWLEHRAQNHTASHLWSARVRIPLMPVSEKVSQFTCGLSVVSSQVHCIWVLSSTNKNWAPPDN